MIRQIAAGKLCKTAHFIPLDRSVALIAVRLTSSDTALLGLPLPWPLWWAPAVGARAGVVIRNAAALETLGKVDTLIVDKTGIHLDEESPTVRTA